MGLELTYTARIRERSLLLISSRAVSAESKRAGGCPATTSATKLRFGSAPSLNSFTWSIESGGGGPGEMLGPDGWIELKRAGKLHGDCQRKSGGTLVGIVLEYEGFDQQKITTLRPSDPGPSVSERVPPRSLITRSFRPPLARLNDPSSDRCVC